ncbi:MAG: hypothetical protein GY730_04165 [bacterium]|nr:hypothetical protein [bacterium]
MLDLIVNSIGRESAMKLISKVPRRGKRSYRLCFYIPKKNKKEHLLVDILGQDTASKLIADLGGCHIQTTNGNSLSRKFRNEAIRKMHKQGLSIVQIAKSIGLTARMVSKILAGPSGGVEAAGKQTPDVSFLRAFKN